MHTKTHNSTEFADNSNSFHPNSTHSPTRPSKIDGSVGKPTLNRQKIQPGINLGRVMNLTRFLKNVSIFRHKYRGCLTTFRHQVGHCFTCPVPEYIRSDKDGESALIVFEDSIPLAHPHAVHSDIENLGQGRYSHWQGWLLFSTSDNSDPTTNGRLYTVREV